MKGQKHNIVVEAVSKFRAAESEPEAGRYVFAYTITIRNDGEVPARLWARHWVITDANGQVQEVRGEGVVGEQPRLEPGEVFRYSSGTVIGTPVGVMQGSYRMISDEGEHFEVKIPPFTLSIPRTLH